MGYIDVYLITAVLFTAGFLSEITTAVKGHFDLSLSKYIYALLAILLLSQTTPDYSDYATLKIIIMIFYSSRMIIGYSKKMSAAGRISIVSIVSLLFAAFPILGIVFDHRSLNGAIIVTTAFYIASVQLTTEGRVRKEGLEAGAVAAVSTALFVISDNFYNLSFAFIVFDLFLVLELYFFYRNEYEKRESIDKRLYNLENRFHRQVENEAKRRTTRMNERIERIKQISQIDPLTKALNRSGIDVELNNLISDPYVKVFSIALLDLDSFKKINDDQGHIAGDEALKYLAGFIMRKNRRTDLLGRYGGDEFLLIMPNINAPEAFKILDRIRREIEANSEPKITISVGISTFPYDGNNISRLIAVADRGTYLSKENGKNCVSYAGNVPIFDKN